MAYCTVVLDPPPASRLPALSGLNPSCPSPNENLLPDGFRPQDSADDHDDKLSVRSTEDDDIGDAPDEQGMVTGLPRLQVYRSAMAGKVIIPDTWGWEQYLQDWVSYGEVEDALRPAGLISARNALVSESQRRDEAVTTARGVSDLLNVPVDVEVS